VFSEADYGWDWPESMRQLQRLWQIAARLESRFRWPINEACLENKENWSARVIFKRGRYPLGRILTQVTNNEAADLVAHALNTLTIAGKLAVSFHLPRRPRESSAASAARWILVSSQL
jgi:hypothetical protein